MLYHITNHQNNSSQHIFVEASCVKSAERYLLNLNPKARIGSIKEMDPELLKPGVPVLSVTNIEEKVMRDALLSSNIDVLDLSVRSYNCLRRTGIKTVEDLISMTEDDLKNIRSLGLKSIDEIISILKDFGETLADKRSLDLTPIHESPKKESSKLSLDSKIKSVAYFADRQVVQDAVLQSDALRRKTLDICYGIPGFRDLPRADANKLYDLVKKSVSLSHENTKQSVPKEPAGR